MELVVKDGSFQLVTSNPHEAEKLMEAIQTTPRFLVTLVQQLGDQLTVELNEQP